MTALLLLLLAGLAATATAASAGDCAGAPDEIACLYARLQKEADKAVRPALAADRATWRKQVSSGCTADCAGENKADRLKRLRALAARVSAENPGLANLNTAWLEGAWQVGPIVALEPFKAPDHVPGLLRPTNVTVKAGELCRTASACYDFGLDPQPLGDADRGALLPLLGLPADWPSYTVLFQGKAVYSLVPQRNGHLFALSVACETASDHCGHVRQDWTPVSADARLMVSTGAAAATNFTALPAAR